MIKNLQSQRGITLIEILVTLVLITLITILAASMLTNGLKTAERVKVEAEIRDEADYLMVQLLNELYLLKTSEIQSKQLQDPANPSHSYLVVRKTGSSTNHQLGLADGKVLLESATLEPSSDDILLEPESQIKEIKQGHYQITLVLKSTVNNRELELTTEVQIITDKEGE
ncbi:PulJ/GspJ family protein [Bacillus suaedae]|uniref:Type II secretion system protein n=1 Tax=Halalkalibacter suaedae TaxID=2822140 RepID=A0A941AM92_9BACI|nr:type II secretion system protein [Bacillus suaedae]MBP3949661.1 type II secretion system protein [Bacillus suaedae]